MTTRLARLDKYKNTKKRQKTLRQRQDKKKTKPRQRIESKTKD